MTRNITLVIYIFAIGLLVTLTGIIIFKLLFWPPCTPIGTKDTSCIVDGWSVAGLAATILGVAAAILALLGAFAVAAWWSDLNKRVSEQVTKIFKEEISKLQAELFDKINALGELRKYVELQEEVTKSVEDTNKALLYLILGNQLVEHKKVAEAIEAYERVKLLRPEDPSVNYILGRTYRGISSYDQAIACLTTSVQTDPSFAPAHYELGLAYRNRADKLYSASDDEMKWDEEYEKAIKLQPANEDALGALGSIYRRGKDYRRALMYYT